MEINKFQDWVKKEFGARLDGMLLEHILAFLLEQSGQLGADDEQHPDPASLPAT